VSDELDSAAINKAIALVQRTLTEAIDFALAGRIEVILGRVPSRDEMQRDIYRLVHIATGENHFFYRGTLILVVVPPKTNNGKFILRTV
jgi:hypothetical protein